MGPCNEYFVLFFVKGDIVGGAVGLVRVAVLALGVLDGPELHRVVGGARE